MRHIKYFFIVLMAILLVQSSCKKEDDGPSVSDSDASDLIVNSFEAGTFGIPSQMEQSSELFKDSLLPANCGYTDDSTVLKYYGGMAIQYNYTFNWTWKVLCAGGTVVSADVDYSSTGNNATTVLTSTFTTLGDFNVTGVEPVTTEFVYNGTYTRNGSMTSLIREENTFDYVLTINLSQVKQSKTTYQISSGSATINLTCTVSDGQTFVFSGTLTFNGSQNCTLVIGTKTLNFQI